MPLTGSGCDFGCGFGLGLGSGLGRGVMNIIDKTASLYDPMQ